MNIQINIGKRVRFFFFFFKPFKRRKIVREEEGRTSAPDPPPSFSALDVLINDHVHIVYIHARERNEH